MVGYFGSWSGRFLDLPRCPRQSRGAFYISERPDGVGVLVGLEGEGEVKTVGQTHARRQELTFRETRRRRESTVGAEEEHAPWPPERQ